MVSNKGIEARLPLLGASFSFFKPILKPPKRNLPPPPIPMNAGKKALSHMKSRPWSPGGLSVLSLFGHWLVFIFCHVFVYQGGGALAAF